MWYPYYENKIGCDRMSKADWKKISHFISTVLLYTILALVGIIVIMFAAYFIDQQIGKKNGESRTPLFGAYVIVSESMVPNINVYDAVITMRASEEDIKVNDVITFISKEIDTKGTPITHRVVGIVYDDQVKKTKVVGYRTKGDHNNTQDFAIIAPNEVLGKMVLRIPYVGYIQRFLTQPIGWLIVIVIPCIIIIAGDVNKIRKSIVKKEDEEEVKEIVVERPVENDNSYSNYNNYYNSYNNNEEEKEDNNGEGII